MGTHIYIYICIYIYIYIYRGVAEGVRSGAPVIGVLRRDVMSESVDSFSVWVIHYKEGIVCGRVESTRMAGL